jgi:urea transport system permease protein
MILLFNIIYQFGDALSFLLLSAIGLAVIFGMMKIINLAHGEFITVGAYATVISGKVLHLPLPIAMAAGVLVTILFGLILEKLVIRHLYGRPLDSVVATWGISLIISQSFLVIFGPSYEGLQTPMGNFKLGDYSYSEYRIFLIFFSVSLLALLYILFMKTSFGALARATIEKPEIASSMGVNVKNVYSGRSYGSFVCSYNDYCPKHRTGFYCQRFHHCSHRRCQPFYWSCTRSCIFKHSPNICYIFL